MKVDIGSLQSNIIFPANILLDHQLRVQSTGPVIARRYPRVGKGDRLSDFFDICSNGEEVSVEALSGSGELLELGPKGGRLELSGWVIPAGEGYFLALRVSFDSHLLEGSDLRISDFAPRDPAVHGLLMFSMQRALLEEQRLATLELEKSRQQSVDLLNRVSRVAGYVAHDFNNFLSIIKLNSDRLALELKDEPRLARLTQIIKSTAARGSAITRSLMTLSHQKSDLRQPIPIDDLIRDNLPFFASTVGSRVLMDHRLDAQGAVVRVSPGGIINCLLNLLINARDAMPDGGTITLRTSTLPKADHAGAKPDDPYSFVRIEVIDTGLGMSEAVLRRAFDPLFSTKLHGNGLGLASVRDFAQEAGGDVRIESEPGRGTRVSLSLPCIDWLAKDDASASPGLPAPGTEGTRPAASDAILVVDDEPFALEALCELLAGQGFSVTGCASSAEARKALEDGPFRVLLTDMILPDENGAALARAAGHLQPGIKVILMSGYVPDEEKLDPEWMFLRKPIDSRVVTEMLLVATRD